MEVVLKVKTPDAAAIPPHADPPARSPGRPSYKSLKKRMRSSFKALRRAVQAGAMPPPEAAASFLSDSLLMVEYPGYGDEHYEAYRQATEALRAALKAAPTDDSPAAAPSGVPPAPAAIPPVTPEIRHAVEELYRLMVLCHDRYK